MRWPLRYQIMLPMAAIMLLSVVAVSGIGAWLAVERTESRIESQIDEVASIVAESNFPLTPSVLRQMKALSGAELVVVDSGGRKLAASGEFRGIPPPGEVSPAEAEFLHQQQTTLDGLSYFHTVVPLVAIRGSGTATLHILYPVEEYRRAWQQAVYPSLAFVVVALPVVMLLAYSASSRIAGRVGRLRQYVDRIAQGDFQQFPLPAGDDEIRSLAVAVNRMSSMLAAYETEVRRTERMRTLAHLGGGIAHQLRNSATGCAMAVDLHAAECPLGSQSEALDMAKQQLRLMEQYLQRFLQLGKPSESAALAPVEMAALIDELLPLVRPAARHAGVDLAWQRPAQEVVIRGDAERLQQLVLNLLVNAIEAAAAARLDNEEPAAVQVVLSTGQAGRLALVIYDTGLGPAERVRENLFDPFVTEKPDGVGLGLSVAREVAQQHGGRIEWRRTDGMTCFSVELPCILMESNGAEAVGCR